MNFHLLKKVLIFDVCFVLFLQAKNQVQNYKFKHTFLYQRNEKKSDRTIAWEISMHSGEETIDVSLSAWVT